MLSGLGIWCLAFVGFMGYFVGVLFYILFYNNLMWRWRFWWCEWICYGGWVWFFVICAVVEGKQWRWVGWDCRLLVVVGGERWKRKKAKHIYLRLLLIINLNSWESLNSQGSLNPCGERFEIHYKIEKQKFEFHWLNNCFKKNV